MRAVVLIVATLVSAAGFVQAQNPGSPPTIFEGARLIDGNGGAPIERSAFMVDGDRFVAVGQQGQIAAPANARHVNLAGKTVIPALIDAHTHPGYRSGLSFSAEHYTRANLVQTLRDLAYDGIGATVSMGTDRGTLPFELRAAPVPGAALFRTAFRGLAMPDSGPLLPLRDSAFSVTTEAEARADVRQLAAQKVDLVKIWIDDRGKTVQKFSPALYGAIIDEAHRNNLRVIAHIFELEDAKGVVRAGVDGLAHLPRDRVVDDEFLALVRSRPQLFFFTTFWGERLGQFEGIPGWLTDPLWQGTLSAEQLAQLRDSFRDATADARQRSRGLVDIMRRNTAAMVAAGARPALGSDSGGPTGGPFFGMAAHIELESLVAAGLTPAQALVAGTRTAAEVAGLSDHGTVAAGKVADFVVLDANPLIDIADTRRISDVYLRGARVDRRR